MKISQLFDDPALAAIFAASEADYGIDDDRAGKRCSAHTFILGL